MSENRKSSINKNVSQEEQISLVHTEYPTSVRFDVAVLSGESNPDSLNHWTHDVAVAIEIKLQQYPERDISYGIVEDYKKIRSYFISRQIHEYVGIPIIFYHNKDDFFNKKSGLRNSIELHEVVKLTLETGMNGYIVCGRDERILKFIPTNMTV